MNQVAINMDNLYNTYIDIQAKKNKINISIPSTSTAIDDITLTNESDVQQIYSDEYIYRKAWNKLNSIHKVIKIKEFITNLSSNDIEMKKTLKTKLVDMIKNKKLTKKTDVNYDMVNGNIISIPILQYVDNKYIIK